MLRGEEFECLNQKVDVSLHILFELVKCLRVPPQVI